MEANVEPGELADFCDIRRRQDKCLCPVIQIGDRNLGVPLAEGVGAAIGYWLIVRNTQSKCFPVGKGKHVNPPVFSSRKTRMRRFRAYKVALDLYLNSHFGTC
ncbi:MAG: hypothetical protein ACLPPF_20370 [Rhodomicrobium sp.]